MATPLGIPAKLNMQDLGTVPGSGNCTSGASAINDLGQVIGSPAFVWTKASGMQDLNRLISPNSGWVLQIATSINLWGQITGVGTINGKSHAFLLTPRNSFEGSGEAER
jgi:hypothetical protein